jgi:hypothetical protein
MRTVSRLWRLVALCALASCAPHRMVKFSLQDGPKTCQGTVDESTRGCEVRYVSTDGDGTTSLSSFRGEMRCGQRVTVCGKPVRCNCL